MIGDGCDGDTELGFPFPADLIMKGGGGNNEGAAGVLEIGPGEDGEGFSKTGVPSDDGTVMNGGAGEVFPLVAAESEDGRRDGRRGDRRRKTGGM